jgi:mono/diheme cytochrome c family protein
MGRNRKLLLAALLVLAVGAVGFVVYKTFRGGPPPPSPGPEEESAAARGARLYAQHCAACHGEKGNGDGPAARFLNPRPRNFGEGKFRLVTTADGGPADADLRHVIESGMPGSAMFPFAHLGEADVLALVAQVRHLTRASLEEQLRLSAAQGGEELDPEVLAKRADRWTVPGDAVEVPAELPEATAESVARGAALYQGRGCASCHGATGKGDGAEKQLNDDGTPTRPRDFTRGIFKSGRDPRRVYARVLRGMPGSPMPASPGLQAAELGDVVNFILSLSDASSQDLVAHRRRELRAKRLPGPLPDEVPEETWAAAAAVPVVVTPLWWREYPEPALRVAAVHDGQTLAVRLTWQDATRNDRAVHTEEFEDMAAAQLFKGGAEPFLGMGSADHGIDLWLWRAGWHREGARGESLLDDYPFDMPHYRELTKGHPGEPPDFLTARAAGNPHARADGASAASLAAKGLGSTSFRPKASQLVTARSAHDGGRWTVVLRRPLAAGPEGGVPLEPGARCSVAFALWDGAARDRNGQKLVSVWQDLTLEE